MIIPIRCISCGKPIAHLWEKYKKRVETGKESKKILDDMGIKKMCCRAAFLSHKDLYQSISKYQR